MSLFSRFFGYLFGRTQKLRNWFGDSFPLAARFYRHWASALLGYPNQGSFRLAHKELSTHSQALQDVFARVVYSHTGLNTYLEIGSGDPESGSNTFILEKMGWSGISVELDESLAQRFKELRTNPILQQDATKLNYVELLSSCNKPITGYLQIDVDPAPQSLACLESIPIKTHRFASITFEHDAYSQGNTVRDIQRDVLEKNGYRLVRSDVTWKPGTPFEDWWVDATLLNKRQVKDIARSLFGVWIPKIGPHGLGRYENEK
jgi:hypothetical protein